MAKLKAARDRKKAITGKCGGRKNHAQLHPQVVEKARELHKQHRSLREIAAELADQGHVNMHGKPFAAKSVLNMLK